LENVWGNRGIIIKIYDKVNADCNWSINV